MSVKIIYLVHGTTTDNQNNISSGWYDVELSELGIQQSVDLKEQLKDKGIDVVYCSDLKRAVDSANITFKNWIPIIVDKRLRECNYGKYNAKPSSIVEPIQKKSISTPFPEGESYEDVKTRIQNLLKDIKDKHNGQTVAFVAHKAPQLALEVIINGKIWEQAFAEDWRKVGKWQPGWEYILN